MEEDRVNRKHWNKSSINKETKKELQRKDSAKHILIVVEKHSDNKGTIGIITEEGKM